MSRHVALLAGVAVLALGGSAQAQQKAQLVQGDDPYFRQAQDTLRRVGTQQRNTNQAKNVILFVGDGMGFSTTTAARIFEGQQRGVDGESNVLTYESFPYLAASKTYSSDGQVSDSAPTATAMMAGVKLKNDVIGLDHTAEVGNCGHMKGKRVTSLLAMAESVGLATGVVTTAKVTHATPAATYAHTSNRDWEDDGLMPDAVKAEGCIDIARQLLEFPYGDGPEVVMGGGRQHFLPGTMDDPEDAGRKGNRKDGRDLMQAWTARYGAGSAAIWNKAQLDAIDPASATHVLGLFERSHMKYEHDRPKDTGGEPSLAEMTEKAIAILRRNPNGFFLMVEAGRIDHASHAGNVFRTLSDAVAFDRAIKAAVAKVDLDETLVVVTADHSHVLTIAGYPVRGNPILGKVVDQAGKMTLATDGKPYTTIGFWNGPGAMKDGGPRPDLTNVDTTDPDYIQQAIVPLNSETHAGEDVGIYAIGPWAHLFQGTVEQNYIFHVMNHATKLSERALAAAGGVPTRRASSD
jgi:alkaline phosphatase